MPAASPSRFATLVVCVLCVAQPLRVDAAMGATGAAGAVGPAGAADDVGPAGAAGAAGAAGSATAAALAGGSAAEVATHTVAEVVAEVAAESKTPTTTPGGGSGVRGRLAMLDWDCAGGESARRASALAAVAIERLAGRVPAGRTAADVIISSNHVSSRVGPGSAERFASCRDSACYAEVAGAAGIEWVVHGKSERFGRRFTLTAVLVDTKTGLPLAQFTETVEEEDDLPWAASKIADRVGDRLGWPQETRPPPAPPPEPTIAHLNLKLGHFLPSLKGFEFSAFAVRLDLEVDYYLQRFLLAYVEAGAVIGRAEATDGGEGNFSLFPVAAGLKLVFRSDKSWRPYAGLGVGLGVIRDLVTPTERKIGLHFNGLAGVAWVPWRRVGFNLETSLNLDDLKLSDGANVLLGFNSNFGVIFLF